MCRIKKKRRFLLVTVLLPLFFGGILYFLLSPQALFVQKIDQLIGIYDRQAWSIIKNPVIKWTRNYLFDLLWAYALTNILSFIYVSNARPIFMSALTALVLGTVLEFLQLTPFVSGTFDLWDIAAEGIGILAGAFIIKRSREDLE